MRYLTFVETQVSKYPVCFLVPHLNRDSIVTDYVLPFGLNQEELLAIDLHQKPGVKKTPKAEMVAYINEELQPVLDEMGVEYLVINDAEYFKTFTKTTKVDANLGYVMDSGFGPQKVVYVPSHKAIFYDPDKVRSKISTGISALVEHRAGNYTPPGNSIIQFAEYPQRLEDIEAWLVKFVDEGIPLAADIEAFSLRHTTAGIGTISFAWSQHEGIAFTVDLGRSNEESQAIRRLLKEFFRQHKAGITWHNIAYDVCVLIYQLFMSDILDTEGLLEGLDALLDNWDCTKLITYLATNSCAGNKLGLKDQAQEFAGNYAVEEITDITKIPEKDLLQYNLIDGLSTWYVKNKHYPTLLADNQREIYEGLFKDATKDIIQMQLTGLPINMRRVAEVRTILEADERKALDTIEQLDLIQEYNEHRLEKYVATKNAEWKKKTTTCAEMRELAKTNANIREAITFNPNSGPQLQELLFEKLGLPVLAVTANKQPSTDGDTLKALKNHTQNQKIIAFLDAMIDYNAVNKILTSFIPAMEAADQGPDGWHYLFGSFNLGGTLSGRLSSSKPNLQNLPATGSRYAKLIKSCFSAPPGWLFMGLDFDSLEDRISAVTTKDPNKLKVYTDGYDGHCLRAHAYFGDKMPDIDPNSVDSINSIAKKYKPERQESKVPTFALTYMGTFITLMKNCGFPKEKAVMIEERYHELYKVSDQWVADKLDQASKDGYVTVAFGLRVRTPLLYQVIRGNSKTPYEAEAEGRSAGNALGQSWCLLNTRAWVATMKQVRASKHRLDIRPCAHIHDAGYALVRDDIGAVKFLNDVLPKEVTWQDHPDIYHEDVKLSGKLGIFFPDWNTEITLPIGATEQEIFAIIDAEMAD